MRMVSTLIDGGRCDVKLKRILCMMLVCLSSMGLFLVPVEAADNINLQAGFIDVYATGRFSLDIPAGEIKAAKSSFPLEAGEVVTIKGAYSPFSASVDFGLIAPNGRFYYLNSKDGCSTELVSIVADENDYPADEYMNGSARAVTVPKTYHNLASSGIYKGSFNSLRGTIYTNKYFDMKDGAYNSRVRCYGEYPSLTYTVGNYCISCKKVLSTYDGNYSTPSETWETGDWESFRHTVASSHTNHFVCPFVTNTSGSINGQLYAIGGDIWVNYTNSWN